MIDSLQKKLKARNSQGNGQIQCNNDDEDEVRLRERIESALLLPERCVKWDGVTGLKNAKEKLNAAVLLPMKFPRLYQNRCRGVLLYGPPGTGIWFMQGLFIIEDVCHFLTAYFIQLSYEIHPGKTYLAKALAAKTNSTFFCVSPANLASKWGGESERLVQTLFEMARESSESNTIIFIDEIDSLCKTRSSNENDDCSRKVLTQFCVEMEKEESNVLVLAATNKPFDIDDAIRRRFDKRIFIPLPNQEARSAMIKIHVGDRPNNLTEFDYEKLGRLTEGATGSDIRNLVEQALDDRMQSYVDATSFRPTKEGYLLPCEYPNCRKCPQELSATSCEQCGARKMHLEDVPSHKIEDPVLSVINFDKVMESASFLSLDAAADDDSNMMYAEFTQKFGMDGSS